MDPREIRVKSPQEALIVEQALAMYREMRDAASNAADGQVIDVAESLAVARGRELTRKALETVLQEEITASEKKGRRPERVLAEELASIGVRKRGHSSRRRGR
jgi:hypothetical protein